MEGTATPRTTRVSAMGVGDMLADSRGVEISLGPDGATRNPGPRVRQFLTLSTAARGVPSPTAFPGRPPVTTGCHQLSFDRLVRVLAVPIVEAVRVVKDGADRAYGYLVGVGIDADLVGLVVADDEEAERRVALVHETMACALA